MNKDDFAVHFRGVIDACSDNYIQANLRGALDRYVRGEPRPSFAERRFRNPADDEPPHSPSGWPGSDQ